MLKLYIIPIAFVVLGPAAFRRLCVETFLKLPSCLLGFPAAFRRLCVETMSKRSLFERLLPSRLQAAVC